MKQMTNYDKVVQFHTAFKHPLGKSFDTDSDAAHELASLRMRLITEEYTELKEAYWEGSYQEFIKELADLLYVVYGMAATYGVPIDEVFNRVHESNMSKLGENGKPIFRDDGKILKGPNYKEPDLTGCRPMPEETDWYEVAERMR